MALCWFHQLRIWPIKVVISLSLSCSLIFHWPLCMTCPLCSFSSRFSFMLFKVPHIPLLEKESECYKHFASHAHSQIASTEAWQPGWVSVLVDDTWVGLPQLPGACKWKCEILCHRTCENVHVCAGKCVSMCMHVDVRMCMCIVYVDTS